MFRGFLHHVCGEHVRSLEERDEGRAFHGGAEGVALCAAVLRHVKHAHVPSDGEEFFLGEFHHPANDETRLFAVTEGKLFVNFVAGIGHPSAVLIFFIFLRASIHAGFAEVVEESGDGDAFRFQRFGEG